ncbi:MAG TPA: threonine synthase [Candidatus Acidoferrales bacterium]|nr:threonine synthase [Candidatus Acidoferrales bacterium]
MTFARDIVCSRCGKLFSRETPVNLCPCGAPLFVRYDLKAIGRALAKASLAARPPTLWRFREFLPVRDDANIVSLGEGCTPLIEATRTARSLGLTRLWIKDEARNPTGSFKDRGLCLAVSMAKELGIERLAIPSAGNAGASLAAYAARAGIEAHVFMPRDTPRANRLEVEKYGGKLTLVEGLIDECARIVTQRKGAEGWFDVSTLKEPYRLEGKKTMGFEIAERLGWRLPDVIVYPTGGGTGLIGMWKAFQELEEVGWIGAKRPRMVTVQAQGCAPIVRAFAAGREKAEPWENAATIASGIRVPQAVGDFLMLRALRESNGTAVSVSDGEIRDEIAFIGRTEGVFLCPEGAAGVAALRRLTAKTWIKPDEEVLIFNTASGLKYAESL